MNEETGTQTEAQAPTTHDDGTVEGLSLNEIRAKMAAEIPGDEPESSDESGNISTPPEKPVEEPKAAEEPRAAKAIANAIKREAEAKRAIKEAEEKAHRAQDILDKALKVKSGEVDPDELLAALGVDYRFITEAKFKNAKPEPDKAEQALSEIEQLKASLAKREQELEQRRVQQEESYAMQQLGAKAREVIAAGGDRYDAIKAYGYEDKVVELQIAHYKATAESGQPEVLTMEQAADTLEQTLAAELQKAASTKYFRSANPQLATSVKVASRPSTITNTLVGTVEPPQQETGISLAEARRRILAMME